MNFKTIENITFVIIAIVIIGFMILALSVPKENGQVIPEPIEQEEVEEKEIESANKVIYIEEAEDSEALKKHSNWTNIGTRVVTMYTSTPSQTDDSPCIGAGGDICEMWLRGQNICATNEFPIGTGLMLWGDFQRSCTVMDRTNGRYSTLIDYYNGFDKDCLDDYQPGDDCPQLRAAQDWGSKEIVVEVYDEVYDVNQEIY